VSIFTLLKQNPRRSHRVGH